MEPTNYLRRAWPILEAQHFKPNDATKAQRECLQRFLRFAPKAQKFCLPGVSEFLPGQSEGVEDRLSSLDWHLPFSSVLIEYTWFDLDAQPFPAMALAVDTGEDIAVYTAGHFGGENLREWMVIPGVLFFTKKPILGQTTRVRMSYDHSLSDTHQRTIRGAMRDQARVVLRLIDALSCSNVFIEPLPVRPVNKSAARRGALPFAAYHVVMVEPRQAKGEDTFSEGIGGEHRSPREHLRRGTIVTNRRGTRFWRQGTVVNPGVGGKITKDYVVKG